MPTRSSDLKREFLRRVPFDHEPLVYNSAELDTRLSGFAAQHGRPTLYGDPGRDGRKNGRKVPAHISYCPGIKATGSYRLARRNVMAFHKLLSAMKSCQPLVNTKGQVLDKYKHFRAFLINNHDALSIMAEREQIYYSGGSFSMAAVKKDMASCWSQSANLLKL